MTADGRQVLKHLRAGSRFVLVLHVRPDGDSVGSTLALARALRLTGKEAVVVRADDLPDSLTFLPGAADTVTADRVEGRFDAAIFLDCAGLDRIGAAAAAVDRAAIILNVDHHPSNSRFGQVNYIAAEAAAVGEIAYELIRSLGVRCDAAISTCLYAAIATDTGSFCYANTRAETHRLAAELVACGARPAEVARQVWENRSLASIRLMARALGTLQVDEGGELAWIEVSAAMLEETGTAAADTEGLVSYPRSLRGVEVAWLLSQDRASEVRVSLRSNLRVDVSRLAARFGGGGHARAAGCVLDGGLAEARGLMLAAAREALRETAAAVPG